MSTFPQFTFGSRLLAGFGTLALAAAIGLAASRPGQSVGGPVAVSIANTPLATTMADNPAKQPVEFQSLLANVGSQVTLYTVPAGKRLVIEYVNVVSNVPNDPNRYSFIVIHNELFANFSLVPDGSPFVATSHKVLMYAEAGTQVRGFFQYSGSNSSPDIYYDVSGYLVNTP